MILIIFTCYWNKQILKDIHNSYVLQWYLLTDVLVQVPNEYYTITSVNTVTFDLG